MTPNNLSRLEDPDYGKQSLSSLKRIAAALDVALVVRFVPFGQYIDWLSGTPHLDEGLSPESLAVPSFEDEEKIAKHETHIRYFAFQVTPSVEASDNLAEVKGICQVMIAPPVAVPVGEREVA